MDDYHNKWNARNITEAIGYFFRRCVSRDRRCEFNVLPIAIYHSIRRTSNEIIRTNYDGARVAAYPGSPVALRPKADSDVRGRQRKPMECWDHACDQQFGGSYR